MYYFYAYYDKIIMGVYMKSIYSMTIQDLESFLLQHEEKKYRASQIMDWLYIKRVNTFIEMTNLSNNLIRFLKMRPGLHAPSLKAPESLHGSLDFS